MSDFISLKPLTANEQYKKNILYKLVGIDTVRFVEKHEDTGGREVVVLNYCLKEQQYGIFANEYRGSAARKGSYKMADVLACIVDEANREIYTTIFDVKRNISAFSDNLLKDNVMLTAIKEVRDFIRQIHDEMLHKNSFMIYYLDKKYKEYEEFGLVTGNFEGPKFVKVAELLEQLLGDRVDNNARLISLKLKNNLRPYMGEAKTLRAFADKKIEINGVLYPLHVFLLDKISDTEYMTSIKLRAVQSRRTTGCQEF